MSRCAKELSIAACPSRCCAFSHRLLCADAVAQPTKSWLSTMHLNMAQKAASPQQGLEQHVTLSPHSCHPTPLTPLLLLPLLLLLLPASLLT